MRGSTVFLIDFVEEKKKLLFYSILVVVKYKETDKKTHDDLERMTQRQTERDRESKPDIQRWKRDR